MFCWTHTQSYMSGSVSCGNLQLPQSPAEKHTQHTANTTLHFNFHLNAAAVIYAALASEPTG